jgi:hypothetical protein
MVILVDVDSLAGDPELTHLLSFRMVNGFTIESHITLVEQPDREPHVVLGEAGTRLVSVPPPDQTKRIAAKIAAGPDCRVSRDVIERALVLQHVSLILHADMTVSPVADGVRGPEARFFERGAIVSVAEALAVIGAHVRQRNPVPLAGIPPLVQVRSEVYRMTARWIVPGGLDLWALAVNNQSSSKEQLRGYAEAVLNRVGQALRGRDGVHEALRVATGRPGLEDALYHFDVVLTSAVGAMDALARFAHLYFGLSSPLRRVGWQRSRWLNELRTASAFVANTVQEKSRLGAALRIITNTRNTIHGIPLSEYLHVEAANMDRPVEHRVSMTLELADELMKVGTPLSPLSEYGVFIGDRQPPVLNVGVFTEQVLAWVLEIMGALIGAIRVAADLEPAGAIKLAKLEQLEREYACALARVGEYPLDRSKMGIPATHSLTLKVMGARARALRKIQDERT